MAPGSALVILKPMFPAKLRPHRSLDFIDAIQGMCTEEKQWKGDNEQPGSRQ
jgi:hypothetical protein